MKGKRTDPDPFTVAELPHQIIGTLSGQAMLLLESVSPFRLDKAKV